MSRSVPEKSTLPEKLRIVGHEIKVEERTSYNDSGLDDCFGYACNARGLIVLDKDNTPDQARETLLHECIHIFERAFQIEFEETEIKRLSRGLYALIKDNPELMAWLQA